MRLRFKNFFRSACLALSLALVFTGFSVFALDKGTRNEDPEESFRIGTAEDMVKFMKKVNEEGHSNLNAILTKDIDMQTIDEVWVPIGIGEEGYRGVFDGKGHVVKNLTYNNTDEEVKSVGLFGNVYGTIKNLGVVDGTIQTMLNTESLVYVGGICGKLCRDDKLTGTISNCFNENTEVIGATEGTTAEVGGICGESHGNIINCYNTGHILGDYDVGGIAGVSDIDVVGDEVFRSSVENCYNRGQINVVNPEAGSEADAGGIIGFTRVELRNCYNRVEVKTNDLFIGGICGGLSKSKEAGVITLETTYFTGNEKGVVKFGEDAKPNHLTEEEMKAQSFIDTLNENRKGHENWLNWIKGPDEYPTLYKPEISISADRTQLGSCSNYTESNVTVKNVGQQTVELNKPESTYNYLDIVIAMDKSKLEPGEEAHFTVYPAETIGHSSDELFSDVTVETTEGVSAVVTMSYVRPSTNDSFWYKAWTGWKYHLASSGEMFLSGWQGNISGWPNCWFYFDPATKVMKKTWFTNVPGWGDAYFYADPNTGVVKTNQWFKDGGDTWYWADSNGVMAKNKWINTNGTWYYVGQTGAMARDTWINTNGVWYYVESTGAMAENKWINTNNKWYYVGQGGAMLVNTTTPDGYRVGPDGAWIEG